MSNSAAERTGFWRDLLSRRASQGLTVDEICQQAGVSRASFYHWQKRIRGEKSPPGRSERSSALLPVEIIEDDRVVAPLEIVAELAFGIRLRVPASADAATLQRVLHAALAACRESAAC